MDGGELGDKNSRMVAETLNVIDQNGARGWKMLLLGNDGNLNRLWNKKRNEGTIPSCV